MQHTLTCPTHSSNKLVCFSFNSKLRKTIFCQECLSDLDSIPQKSLLSIDLILKDSQEPLKSAKEVAPAQSRYQHFSEIISGVKEGFTRLKEQVATQKIQIETTFGKIEAAMLDSLYKHKSRLLDGLELSIITFGQNFELVKQRISEIEEYEQEKVQLDKDLTGTLKAVGTAEELERKIKEIGLKHEKFLENKMDESEIYWQAEDLGEQMKYLFSQTPQIANIAALKEHGVFRKIERFVDEMFQNINLEDTIEKIEVSRNYQSKDSYRFQAPTVGVDALEFLKNCSKSLKTEEMNLNSKYKASKDGYEIKKIGRTIKFYEKSLVIITCHDDRKFGFFTDPVKSISLDFDEKESKQHSSFIVTYNREEQKNSTLLALGSIKLKNDCNKHDNNMASFDTPVNFKVKDIEIYEITGTYENSSPVKTNRVKPQPTPEPISKLEKKFTLLHTLIKQKMKL